MVQYAPAHARIEHEQARRLDALTFSAVRRGMRLPQHTTPYGIHAAEEAIRAGGASPLGQFVLLEADADAPGAGGLPQLPPAGELMDISPRQCETNLPLSDELALDGRRELECFMARQPLFVRVDT